MDLRQGYNDVQIKKGDKWKVAFTMHLGVYEPTVMFFSLTNLPATFQAMMNDILRDLINTGEVVVFMDDVLAGTEEERKHDEIVKEVLRRIEKNNLYIKPEKCMWKVREINFLRLVIGSGRIKIQEKKVVKVLEQPRPKTVKEVWRSFQDQQTIIGNLSKTSLKQLNQYTNWSERMKNEVGKRNKRWHSSS